MKTISKRFLKGALAILLAITMLFGSCISGFAAVVDNADTSANVDAAETGATERYIYVGISNNYQTYKTDGQYGFNFWGGSNGGVKSGTYLTSYTWDGRKYYMYRVSVSDDNNKAQFKGNNNWWDPGDGFSVTLNGTTNNAIFFSHQNDGWQGQFQQNYQETSTGALSASSTSVPTNTAVTLTPSLSSNGEYNDIRSTAYSIDETSGASISDNTFTATSPGTYTVTATITYNPKYFTGITKTCTAKTTIEVTPTVDDGFKMDYGMEAIGNYGTGYTTYGTVAMAIGDTALAKGGYADETETVTYTATANENFIFDGWYSDESCSLGSLLTRETSYDVTPTKDTTLYALFVPKHYIAEDQSKVNTNVEMTYDPETRSFKYTTSTISKSAWFRVSNNPTAWTDNDSYSIFDESNFSVTFNSNAYLVTVDWGTQCYKLTSDLSAEHPYEIIVALNGNSSIDVSCKAAVVGIGSVFLSSGRLDLPGSYDAAAFEANIKYTHIAENDNPTDTYVENTYVENDVEISEKREKYRKLNLTEAQTVSFEVEITGTRAADYEVDSFVVYHINTETYTIITPTTLGNNKYSGSVYLDGDAYIVPVYFLTAKYAEANDLAEIDIYFDATAIKDNAWGPFVACYAWGSAGAEYHGGWSGQMMIPTADGKSFYTMLTVPKATATNPSSIPNGVTFNNYMQSTVPGSNPGAFGLSSTQYQCYDYREPITLYESGYDVITFVAKDSTDGYHGDRANGVTENTVTNTTTDIFNKYDFDYLYSRDGVTPMDLNGDTIVNPVDLSVGKADYYIINKGDITYDPNGTKYVGDDAYDADWSVDWYIFDSTGNFITNIMSTAMWHDKDGNLENGLTSYLHDALGVTAADVAGKTVAISYEHENNAGHQISYDGQWYGNYLTDTVTGQVKVGYQTSSGIVIDDDEAPNVADYGEAYLVDADGNKHQTLDIEMEYGIADITAVTKGSYTFVGWYTQLADGSYKKISTATTDNPYINMNETYYAIFRAVAEGEVVINHSTYVNDDPAIPSHGGVAEMSIEVTDKTGGTVYKCTPSTSRTSVSFKGVEGHTYTVKIITTPLMNGEFFAWYTDSLKADGTKTYEEVFTDETQIGSTATVEATFDYEYTQDSQKIINIYSDVKRVSNTADLYYKYLNRYGQWRTYTVRDIELTDDECMGYAGNEGQAYYPTYLTKYTLAGGEVVYGEEALADRAFEDSYNMIQYYAPNEEVTEVFNGTVSWLVDKATVTPGKSIVTIVADQGTPNYTITYDMGGEIGSVTGKYNTLVDDIKPIVAPDEYNGAKFAYWVELKDIDGDGNDDQEVFLSYQKNYSYRIVEDKKIKAIYSNEEVDDWTPSIDSVTYTREFSDDSDVIYTDFLLAYNSKNGLKLNDVKTDMNITYGLIMVQDPNSSYTGENDTLVFPAYNEENLKKSALAGKNALIGGIRYYNFDLTNLTLTNFNRCDYFKSYDNRDTANNFKSVEYTCVAYMVVDGTVYLSTPQYVNFYDLAMTDYSTAN